MIKVWTKIISKPMQCDAMGDDRKYLHENIQHRAINNKRNSIEVIENISKEVIENNNFIMHHCLYHITKY